MIAMAQVFRESSNPANVEPGTVAGIESESSV